MSDESSSDPPSKPARRQGPKRSAASTNAILDAVRDELADSGWRAFSVDNVARRARASKQTIYRWWPSIGALCVEAAIDMIPGRPESGPDPVERLAAILAPLEAAARTGSGGHVLRAALIAAADDDDAGARWRGWMQAEIRTPLRMLLAELAAKQIVGRDWEMDRLLDALLGPFVYRLTIMRAPIAEGYSVGRADMLLRSLRI